MPPIYNANFISGKHTTINRINFPALFVGGLSLAYKTDKTKFLVYLPEKGEFAEQKIKREDTSNLVNLEYPHSWSDRACNNPTHIAQNNNVISIAKTKYYGNDYGDRQVLYNNNIVSNTYSDFYELSSGAEFDRNEQFRNVYRMFSNNISSGDSATLGIFFINALDDLANRYKALTGYVLYFYEDWVYLYEVPIPSLKDLEQGVLAEFPAEPLFWKKITFEIPPGSVSYYYDDTGQEFLASYPSEDGSYIIHNFWIRGFSGGVEASTNTGTIILTVLKEDEDNPSTPTGFDVQQIMNGGPNIYTYVYPIIYYTESYVYDEREPIEPYDTLTVINGWVGSASYTETVTAGAQPDSIHCYEGEVEVPCECLIWLYIEKSDCTANFSRTRTDSNTISEPINMTNNLGHVPGVDNSIVKLSYDVIYSGGAIEQEETENLIINIEGSPITYFKSVSDGDGDPDGCGEFSEPCSGVQGTTSVFHSGGEGVADWDYTLSKTADSVITKNFYVNDIVKFELFSNVVSEVIESSGSTNYQVGEFSPTNTSSDISSVTSSNVTTSRQLLYIDVINDFYVLEVVTMNVSATRNTSSSYIRDGTTESTDVKSTSHNITYALELLDKGVSTILESFSFITQNESFDGVYLLSIPGLSAPGLNPFYPGYYWDKAEYSYDCSGGSGSVSGKNTKPNSIEETVEQRHLSDNRNGAYNTPNNLPSYLFTLIYPHIGNDEHYRLYNFWSEAFATFHISEFNGDIIFLYEYLPDASVDTNNPPKGIWFNGIIIDPSTGDSTLGIPPFDDIYFSFVS